MLCDDAVCILYELLYVQNSFHGPPKIGGIQRHNLTGDEPIPLGYCFIPVV